MIELLKKVHCFSDLDEETLLIVKKVVQPATFKTGERLCTEGEIGDQMFIIELVKSLYKRD